MSGLFWGAHTYADGSRVPLRTERCVSKPLGVPGTHTCRQHREHVVNVVTETHRCICGLRWNASGTVQK